MINNYCVRLNIVRYNTASNYHISRIWVNEIIITSAFSVDLEKSSVGRNLNCPAGGQIYHATWLRGSCDGESSRVNFVRCRDEDEYDGYA